MAKQAMLSDEEVAVKIVQIYFEEVARFGLKRSLDLDAIINAYYYALARLAHKEKELETVEKQVQKEEKKIVVETKEELVPAPAMAVKTTTTTTETKK